MQPDILSKWSLFTIRTTEIIISLIMILFLIFALFRIYYPVQAIGNLGAVKDTASQKQVTFGIPINLRIPILNIDTSLESVGLTSKGAVDVPKVSTHAAWYNLSPRPGEVGNSIIDGHSGWKDGVQSVFDNLYKIKKGDRIYIEDNKGLIISFIVKDFKPYGPNDDLSVIFNSSDDGAHLNLITCVGDWDVNQKSPNDRFVVFSDKE